MNVFSVKEIRFLMTHVYFASGNLKMIYLFKTLKNEKIRFLELI